MQAEVQYLSHFIKTCFPAFFTFTIYQYAASFINQSKNRDLRHFHFSNGFIRRAWNKWRSDRYIHKRIMVAYDNVVFVFLKILFPFYKKPGTCKEKKYPHPDS